MPIPDEANFWEFVKSCFKQPRRTLKNNLAQKHYDLNKIPEDDPCSKSPADEY